MARFSKLHPCFGFLHCQADHYRVIYNRLCQMRDDDIKNGNLSSGLPTGFQAWAFNDLKTKAADPFYAKQIKEHLGQLDITIEATQRQLNTTYLSEKLKELEEKKESLSGLIAPE